MSRALSLLLGALLSSLLVALPAVATDGKAVFDQSCAGCHAVMAPKFGDKAAWAPFVKQGAATLTATVVKGKGAMPPKGGAASEADVKAAIEYVISQMQ